MSSVRPRIVVVIQARTGSTRLPGKVLADIAGEPLLARVVARAQRLRNADQTVVATSIAPGDDAIESLCAERDWECYRGSEDDVLDRYFRTAVAHEATHVVRVTADCPFLCPREGDRVIARHLETGSDYAHNITVWGSGMPLGTGTEIFTIAALERSWREGHEPQHREHVDEYVGDHPELFRMERVDAPPHLQRPALRLTIDTAEDLELTRRIYARVPAPVELADVVMLLDESPELVEINRHVAQKSI
jgi:spore coat polysaccharide biosynthesis protein SpsF